MDWIPLIGSWALGFQIALFSLIALAVFLLWVGDGLVIALMLIGFVFIAGFATATPSPVPQSSVEIARAAEMERKVFRVRSEGHRADLVLLGWQTEDTFRVVGFQERIRGGKVTDHREWEITALPIQSRGWGGDANTSVSGETLIRANGTWQEGRVSQQAVFARGETYSLSYWFGPGVERVQIPVSF